MNLIINFNNIKIEEFILIVKRKIKIISKKFNEIFSFEYIISIDKKHFILI
jgi:hypothetical protein